MPLCTIEKSSFSRSCCSLKCPFSSVHSATGDGHLGKTFYLSTNFLTQVVLFLLHLIFFSGKNSYNNHSMELLSIFFCKPLLPYSGFYWRTANLAISSFLQIGEDLTWRSLPTSHHTHINIDHTHHEIAIIVIYSLYHR